MQLGPRSTAPAARDSLDDRALVGASVGARLPHPRGDADEPARAPFEGRLDSVGEAGGRNREDDELGRLRQLVE